MTAAERRWIVEGTPELNQPRCFVNALTLKWKSKKYIFIWERGYVFVSTKKRNNVDSFEINRDLSGEDLLKFMTTDIKK